MKQRYLTVYDYGQGGVWQYIHALSPEQIKAKYPAIQVVSSEPAWIATSANLLREYDIDSEPDSVLRGFTKS